MKRLVTLAMVISIAACSKTTPPEPPKPEGMSEIKSPTTSLPPVQALSYDVGYQSGDIAGEAAARTARAQHPKQTLATSTDAERDVLALQAAGADVTRGQKWQRGYADGFRDGFERVTEGKR